MAKTPIQQTALFERETFKRRFQNESDLTAGSFFIIEYREIAERLNELPHNKLFLANLDASVKLFLYFDDNSSQDTPDLIVLPNQQMVVSPEEGTTWTTLFIKNSHASSTVSAGDIKGIVATVRKVPVKSGVY